MRKHDFTTLVLISLAAIGAGLYYYSEYPIAGQIIFFVVALASVLHIKFLSAPLQLWWAMIICTCLGGISGDWWLSIATFLSFVALLIRPLFFQEAIYSRALWSEPVLVTVGTAVYVVVNIFHHNSWQGWVGPLAVIVPRVIIGSVTYFDRREVARMVALGMMETGTAAPDFTLTNYDGKIISLSDYKDKRHVLLIFVRGDWCPGCHIMLRLYERERKKFQEKNIMLFAIGPDPVGVNLEMVKKLGVEFAVLSDEHLEVSKKFCVRIQENVPGTKYDPGIPLPASFLVDKKGIIRYTSRADRAGEFLNPMLLFSVLEKVGD